MLNTQRNYLHPPNRTRLEFGNCRGVKIRLHRLVGVARVCVFVIRMGRLAYRRSPGVLSALFVHQRAPQSKFMWVSGGRREARLGCLWATSPHPPLDWMLPGHPLFPSPSPRVAPLRTTPRTSPAPATRAPQAWGSLLSYCGVMKGVKHGRREFGVICGRRQGGGRLEKGGAAERWLCTRQFPRAAAASSRSSDVFTFQNGGKEAQALAVHR